MRWRLQIFSSAFIAIFAFLQAHPLLENPVVIKGEKRAIEQSSKPICIKKKKAVCMKSDCPLPKKDFGESEDCRNNSCNPFVPCSMGFCCYLVESFFSYSNIYIASKQRVLFFDDNRIANGLSECWHPPELIS
jgi:hypothetical protein